MDVRGGRCSEIQDGRAAIVVNYAPGTEETDPKKQNMALQHLASATTTAQEDIETNTTDIATNTANIATNTTNIATNTADIAALEAAQFPSGTRLVFQQTAAPTGWTKDTTHNDKALRVVSGTASSGGTNAFSTVMAQTTVGSHTLALSEIPSHAHSYTAPGSSTFAGDDVITPPGIAVSAPGSGSTTGSQGGGGSHNHTITMAMQYVDVVLCSKD